MAQKLNPRDGGAELTVGFSVRMRHGDILRVMQERGWNGKQMAKALGMGLLNFYALLNFRRIPKRRDSPWQAKLMELTGKTMEEMFPEWLHEDWFTDAPKKQIIYQELTPQILEQARAKELPSPEDLVENAEQLLLLRKALGTLKPRYQVVVQMSLEGMTAGQIAEKLGLSRSRVDQILKNAQRDLKKAVEEFRVQEERVAKARLPEDLQIRYPKTEIVDRPAGQTVKLGSGTCTRESGDFCPLLSEENPFCRIHGDLYYYRRRLGTAAWQRHD